MFCFQFGLFFLKAKVREATNDEKWGPTGIQMQELAQHTLTYESYPEVMGMLWKRMLQDSSFSWRRVYKSLTLLNYLVTHGSERVVTSAREHVYELRRLENFTFIDEMGKDQGINVRQKAKLLIELIQDDDKIRQERKKAKQYKDKFIGVSSESAYANRLCFYFCIRLCVGVNCGIISSFFSYRDSWSDFPTKSDKYDSSYKEDFEDRVEKPKDIENIEEPESNEPTNASISLPKQFIDSSKKPKARNLKKIDLGAAAIYAQEHRQDNQQEPSATVTQPVANQNADLLNDLFSNMNVAPKNDLLSLDTTDQFNSNTTTVEDSFADFTKYEESGTTAAEPSNEEFADFQCAFDTAAPSNNSMTVNLFNDCSQIIQQPNVVSANSFTAMNPFLTATQTMAQPTQTLVQPTLLPTTTPTPLAPVTVSSKTNTTQKIGKQRTCLLYSKL